MKRRILVVAMIISLAIMLLPISAIAYGENETQPQTYDDYDSNAPYPEPDPEDPPNPEDLPGAGDTPPGQENAGPDPPNGENNNIAWSLLCGMTLHEER